MHTLLPWMHHVLEEAEGMPLVAVPQLEAPLELIQALKNAVCCNADRVVLVLSAEQ